MITNVLIINPSAAYTHWQVLTDTALPIAYALRSLGHPAEVTLDATALPGKTLVFGAHLIPQFGGAIEGGDYILFNLEQRGSQWFTPEYLDILRRYEVWDYSTANVEYLKSQGIEAKHCPIGYHPCMSNIRVHKSPTLLGGPSSPCRIDYQAWPGESLPIGVFDVLFYGSMNDRRNKIMEELRAEGIHAVSVSGYGFYRDKYVERAKIVLNINYYEDGLFNITRCAPLMANQKCIVSEKSVGGESFGDAMATVTYDGIVAKCKELLADDNERELIARKGYDLIRRTLQADILKGIL